MLINLVGIPSQGIRIPNYLIETYITILSVIHQSGKKPNPNSQICVSNVKYLRIWKSIKKY